MEILFILIFSFVIFVPLKTYVFSSEEEKCFRQIWSMNKLRLFTEEEATYKRLFKKFDIDFSTNVSDEKLRDIVGAAHKFDLTKNQKNFGIFVGPIVQNKIKTLMYKYEKTEQYDHFASVQSEKGRTLIDNSFTEFTRDSCVQHLREISKDIAGLNFEDDIEKKCVDLAFLMAMVDGEIDDKEPEAIKSSMNITLSKQVNYSAYGDIRYLNELNKKPYMEVAGEIQSNLIKLVSNSQFPKSGSIAASTFEQSLIASIATIAAIDGVVHENEKEFISNIIDLYEMGSEYKNYILSVMSDAAARLSS